MNTNQSLTRGARKNRGIGRAEDLSPCVRSFRRKVKGELAARGETVSGLAKRIGRHRTAVSRAINRGQYRGVQELIAKELKL